MPPNLKCKVHGSNLSLPTLTPDFDIDFVCVCTFGLELLGLVYGLVCNWIGFYTWHWLLGGVDLDSWPLKKERKKTG